jgi:hypothetical protein
VLSQAQSEDERWELLHKLLAAQSTRLSGHVVCRLLASFSVCDAAKVLFLVTSLTPGVEARGLAAVLGLFPDERQRLAILRALL